MSKLVTDLRIDALAGSLPDIARHDFTRAADRIEVLEAALHKHHTGIGCVNYCRTCGGHFSWEKPEAPVSFTTETEAKCPDCGVLYVKGARHFSECPSKPGAIVETPAEPNYKYQEPSNLPAQSTVTKPPASEICQHYARRSVCSLCSPPSDRGAKS